MIVIYSHVVKVPCKLMQQLIHTNISAIQILLTDCESEKIHLRIKVNVDWLEGLGGCVGMVSYD